jgi:hypothetical protein
MDVFVARGRTATVTFDGETIRLAPTAAAKLGGRRGDWLLSVRHLTGVQMSAAHWGTLGFIRFVTGSSPASMDRRGAITDPHAVVFTRRRMGEFVPLYEAVAGRIGWAGRLRPHRPSTGGE